MPELPEARRKRMIAEYDITMQDAQTLTATREFADQFETAARQARSPRRVANLIQSELMGRLKAKGLELEQSPITMEGLVQAADLAEAGELSSKQLKGLFDTAFENGEDFGAVYEREKPQQISDPGGAREADPGSHCGQSQAAGAVSRGQEDGGCIFCGPGDAVVKRTGQSGAAE